jgi:hypothetical protein
MPVIKSHEEYFQIVREFNLAPQWRQELLITGFLLTKCKDMQPMNVRLRLQRFWDRQAHRLGVSVGELKTWS